LCAQLLRRWRKRHEGIDLTLREERSSVGRATRCPVDIPPGIEAHLRGHGAEEDMLCASERGYADLLPLEVANRMHPVGPDQLEAPDMPPAQYHGRGPRIQPDEVRTNEVQAEVHGSGLQFLKQFADAASHPLHVGEPFSPEQLLGEIERRLTRAAELKQPDP